MSLFKNIFGSTNKERNSSTINWRELTDLGQLNDIVDASFEQPVLIFKHSTRCGVSRSVLRQFENEFDATLKITPYFLDLLEHRDISNEIASRFGVVHQSPQLIVIKEGNAIYNVSHDSIDAHDLKTLG
ncbi:MAG: bacillithiol system redox-active protein YtxJ [Flavobacterium sp.]|nr:bacillithiol system redox-active protein YtxJ [Flavobacterium sp.]